MGGAPTRRGEQKSPPGASRQYISHENRFSRLVNSTLSGRGLAHLRTHSLMSVWSGIVPVLHVPNRRFRDW